MYQRRFTLSCSHRTRGDLRRLLSAICRSAHPLCRMLEPLATQMSTGLLRLTLVHFRVRIASVALTKRPLRWSGLFVNAPEAIRTPDARLGKERFWDYRNFQPLCGFSVEISMLTAVACLWYLLVYFGKIRPQMKTFGQQKGCGCGSFIKAVMVKIVCKTDKIFQLVIAVYCKLVYTHG